MSHDHRTKLLQLLLPLLACELTDLTETMSCTRCNAIKTKYISINRQNIYCNFAIQFEKKKKLRLIVFKCIQLFAKQRTQLLCLQVILKVKSIVMLYRIVWLSFCLLPYASILICTEMRHTQQQFACTRCNMNHSPMYLRSHLSEQ